METETFVIGGTPLPTIDELSIDDEKKCSDREAMSILSSKDPVTGLEYDWLNIRDRLCNGDLPGAVLPDIFNYYCEQNPKMDLWMNYLLSCSHFTKEELDGSQNRNGRKKLEQSVKKMLTARSKNPHQNIREFMSQQKI